MPTSSARGDAPCERKVWVQLDVRSRWLLAKLDLAALFGGKRPMNLTDVACHGVDSFGSLAS